MSVQNPDRLATKQDLKDMYDRIRPYMGGLVTSKAGFTPVGTVISVMGTTAPVNYLACDGTVYNIADYTELANYFNEQFGSTNFFGGNGTTTFAVPDLRGEFLRGTGTNSHENQGSGASVGVHQDATEHLIFYTYNKASIGTFAEDGYNAVNGDSNHNPDSLKTLSTNVRNVSVGVGNQGDTNTASRYTSRPTNTSVLYCIATKNFYIDPTLDYSTDEKVVGTWIDGEPIYQKTFTVPLTANTSSVVHNISLGTMVSVVGTTIAKDGGGQQRPIPFTYYDNSAWNAVAYMNNNNIVVQVGNSFLAKHDTAYITCQYTKTTD